MLNDIISKVFPEPLKAPSDWEADYPPRDLPDGAMVTRVGPSPTGLMHIGTLYVGLLSKRLAQQSGGACFLRVEDTDKKREVEGATQYILEQFKNFHVEFDEGQTLTGDETGAYGPYKQSARKNIYHTYIKSLLEQGKAYLCFATPEELDEIRERQQLSGGMRTGYFGKWAVWRNKSLEEVKAALDEGKPFVIRFKSDGNNDAKIEFDDLMFGKRALPQNDQDIVIMKRDGLPTYHFAHAVDDHLMRTTLVTRGDEWLSSVPTHLQLFDALGWEPPKYAHIAPINKMDGASRRKLSKRKDPEANLGYFVELGYPVEGLNEYLLTLANSNFEEWREENPDVSYADFEISLQKLQNSSGPLFDFVKLESISRDVIGRLSAAEIYDRVVAWAAVQDSELEGWLKSDPDYVRAILNIEREGPKVRKDIAKWSDVKGDITCFFDDQFALTAEQALEQLEKLSADDVRAIVSAFKDSFDFGDDRDTWFGKVKDIAGAQGFALRPKDYKKNPDAYKGTVADVAKVFRVLLAGRPQTPDLYSVIQVMGQDRVFARLALLDA